MRAVPMETSVPQAGAGLHCSMGGSVPEWNSMFHGAVCTGVRGVCLRGGRCGAAGEEMAVKHGETVKQSNSVY
jgi:hypothetical protein